MPVHDRHNDLVGVVHKVTGPLVTLRRPAGFTWDTKLVYLRPANEREQRQLVALANHYRSSLPPKAHR